ncbi:adenosine deaminase-related growth [Anaeromyces robustus]|uniref:adenosine deaminase n=1 Tax=Anaeromyces robustus TaxID=1754192 RepID=A0A1Y1XP97_9FUNG|nr:adenosine deaminase-related growth [Anaeromyces robustus]|eukprot:ORX87578.1 adenosine deaminase-related growth [Anaeromyces robustus]
MLKEDFIKEKNLLLEKDRNESFDGEAYKNHSLEEEFANAILQENKEKDLKMFKELSEAPFSAIHFSEIKKFVEGKNSYLLNSITALPKGIIHHCHIDALVDAKWIIEKVISSDTLYLKFIGDSSMDNLNVADFQFFKDGINETQKQEGWLHVKDVRNQYKKGTAAFDQWLYECFTIVPTNKEDIVYTENEIWDRFSRTFISIRGIFSYVPFTKLYVEEIIKRYSKKDLQQVEIRIPYYEPYDDTGIIEFSKMFGELVKTIEENQEKLNLVGDDYFELKFIISPVRNTKQEEMVKIMNITAELFKKYPKYVVGFDMVGHEHLMTLEAHIDSLLNFKKQQKKLGIDIPFYFHAGETTDSGSATDKNLFDAVILDTKRIGHGYSLSRHLPTLGPIIKEKEMCLEISPISNQYLGLVKDMKNHPIIIFLKNNIPVSVSPDDPSLYGYEGSTYDFYMLFMSFENFDLWTLKQLCINSIKYGSFTKEYSKEEMLKVWEKKWESWIKKIISNNKDIIMTN